MQPNDMALVHLVTSIRCIALFGIRRRLLHVNYDTETATADERQGRS
jgi:hypothetical protein